MRAIHMAVAVTALLLARPARADGQGCADVPGAVAPVSLNEAVAGARRHAALVRREQAMLARRRADERAAGAALLPTLDATVSLADRSYSRAQQGLGPLPNTSTPVVGPFADQDYRVTARVVVTPFAAWRSAAAARTETRAAEAALSASLGDAAFDAARAYVRLAHAAAECSARRVELALARRLLDIARTRVRLGAAARTDSLRAAAQLAAAEGAIARATFVRDSARTTLAIAMGLAVIMPIVPTDSMGALATLPSDTSVPLGAARLAREVMSSLAGSARAARLRVRAAAATRLPLVTLTADAGGNGRRLGDVRATGGIALGISLPLFDGGLARGEVEARRAEAAEAASAVQAARDALAAELADARAHIRNAEAQVTSAASMTALALAGFDDTEARYRAGDVGSLDVVEAFRAVVHARDARLDAESEAAVARLQWMHAIGLFDDAASRIGPDRDLRAAPGDSSCGCSSDSK